MSSEAHILDALYAVIESRRGGDPETSHTARLLAAGRPAIAAKVGEEATEVVIAALAEGRDATIRESADLMYHLLVLMADCGITPGDVWAELERRQGTSGITEKRNRDV